MIHSYSWKVFSLSYHTKENDIQNIQAITNALSDNNKSSCTKALVKTQHTVILATTPEMKIQISRYPLNFGNTKKCLANKVAVIMGHWKKAHYFPFEKVAVKKWW